MTIQHSHERAIERANQAARAEGLQKPAIEPFEYYCWRHTCGTRWAEAGMDKYTVARLMGHSSPRVAEPITPDHRPPYVEAREQSRLSE